MKFVSKALDLSSGGKLLLQLVILNGTAYLYATDSEPSLNLLALTLQTPYVLSFNQRMSSPLALSRFSRNPVATTWRKAVWIYRDGCASG